MNVKTFTKNISSTSKVAIDAASLKAIHTLDESCSSLSAAASSSSFKDIDDSRDVPR